MVYPAPGENEQSEGADYRAGKPTNGDSFDNYTGTGGVLKYRLYNGGREPEIEVALMDGTVNPVLTFYRNLLIILR